MTKLLRSLFVAFVLAPVASLQASPLEEPVSSKSGGEPSCYLFTYFTGNGEDGLHFARSEDGLTWTALNDGKSFLRPAVGKSKLMRDPCLLQGPDGTFHLVWTDSWGSQTIGHASSKDLINWSDQQAIPVMGHEPKALNCWAPEVSYDEATQEYVLFWSTTIPGRFPATDEAGDKNYNHRIYSTTTRDFKTFSPTRLFYDGGFNVIDATLLRANGTFNLIVKDETKTPVKKNLRIVPGTSVQGPFGQAGEPFTPAWVEGPSAVRMGDEYVVYFDCYGKGHYGAMKSRDLEHWEDLTPQLKFPKGVRHGTVLQVSKTLLVKLSAIHDRGDLKLAALFSDHMVLQRDKPVPVWGWAGKGERVTVAFAGQEKTAIAGADGRWQVKLDPMAACSVPGQLRVSSTHNVLPLTVADVLIGEVWLASGQSNMAFTLGWGCLDGESEKAGAKFPLIRQFGVRAVANLQPQASVEGAWNVCSPETVGGFSAVAYFFARDIHRKLGVPIGIIHASWGGSRIECWTSREALVAVPELKELAAKQIDEMVRQAGEHAAFPAALSAWEAANGWTDTENAGLARGWAAPELDDSAWQEAKPPFYMPKIFPGNTGGIVWFRKRVELPPESAGKPFTLCLYGNQLRDTLYFNGTVIGQGGKSAPDFHTGGRNYKIPGNLVKSGRNVIAARLVTTSPGSAFGADVRKMGLPVAKGRSVEEAWRINIERTYGPLSREAIASQPPLNRAVVHGTAAGIFNGMIHPLASYALRGVIWYQGESNTQKEYSGLYKSLLSAMIRDWRSRWGEPPSPGSGAPGGDFPFYIVQLANNGKPEREHRDTMWSEVCEAQRLTLSAVPNAGMAVIVDIGERDSSHPGNKQDVGARLALWARAKTYGEKGLVYQSPFYKSHAIEGGKIRVIFDTGGSPLMIGKKTGLEPVQETPGVKLDWFEIAGTDGKYVWADGLIDGDSVVVFSPEVPHPTKVRYAWASNPEGCNLYNKAGLPASPFRTDNK